MLFSGQGSFSEAALLCNGGDLLTPAGETPGHAFMLLDVLEVPCAAVPPYKLAWKGPWLPLGFGAPAQKCTTFCSQIFQQSFI